MTKFEKLELKTTKLNWRSTMRKFFGETWTKRKASLITPSGRRQMNLPLKIVS